jgi:hypothetical protein
MKIKRVLQTCLAAVLGVSSVLVISVPSVFASGNNCLWNGSSSANFNTAANWTNCGGSVPGTGDNLIFDNTTIPSSGSDLVDDISGTVFANLTFQGSGSTGYTVTIVSGSLNLSGNITDTTSNSAGGGTIDAPIVLSGATPTVTIANSLDLLGGSNSLTIGSSTVTFSGNGIIENNFPIIGTGTLDFDMGSAADFQQNSASSSFTGQINVEAGTLDVSSNANPYPDYFGASSGITVANGATLFYDDPAVTSATIGEPITAAGNGAPSCTNVFNNNSVVDCGAIEGGLAFGGNLTLSGDITLSANSQFNDNDTLTITGPLSGAFTVENAVGTLVVDSSNNTSGTANGTYEAGGNLQNGSGSPSSDSSKATPKTPDTGLALLAAHPLETLIFATAAAFTILLIAHRLKTVKQLS